MRKIFVIGIGAGNPDHVTIEAIKALNAVDVFFVLDKGEAKDDLVALRRDICERFIEDQSFRTVEIADPQRDRAPKAYEAEVLAWHERRTELYEQSIIGELGEDDCGAFLVWGDPSLYDSTLRIIDQIVARKAVPFDYEVIPGISSVQVLAARHRIALNRIGRSIQIMTGRKLAEGMPRDIDDVVVMLDGDCTFRTITEHGIDIYWGAYLGSVDEILIAGDLHERMREIERIRSEARARKGWIMDTYLLRRRDR